MTFTATLPIGYYPGSARELFIEDAPLVVEFEADVRIYRDPVEVDWPPVIERGVSVDCDASSVDVAAAWLEGQCEGCGGHGGHIWIETALGGMDESGESFPIGIKQEQLCPVCYGKGTHRFDILPTLSPLS